MLQATRPKSKPPLDRTRSQPLRRLRASALAGSCLALLLGAGDGAPPHFYSTARAPADYAGPVPTSSLGIIDRSVRTTAGDPPAKPAADRPPDGLPPIAALPAEVEPSQRPTATPASTDQPMTRLASAASEADAANPSRTELDLKANAGTRPPEAVEEPAVRAQRLIASCRESYSKIRDYSCTFYKRERVDGELMPYHVLEMKSRTQPFSIYFRFARPYAGREAIYVHGRNRNQVVVHDVGLNKVLAGTLALDPRSRRAMDENRHPITDAGIGHLIETVANRWSLEMKPGETQVTITPGVKVDGRPCTLIESTHPKRAPGYLFRTAKVYIDQEHNLPIRFEAYDWPHRAGQPPALMEEYTYAKLRLDVGLSEHDFDPANQAYSFGRF